MALNISLPRFQDPYFQAGSDVKVNTVFEDPKKFYEYPDYNLIISREPVRVYQVKQIKNELPTVHFLGNKWAIFTYFTYHFNSISLRISVE